MEWIDGPTDGVKVLSLRPVQVTRRRGARAARKHAAPNVRRPGRPPLERARCQTKTAGDESDVPQLSAIVQSGWRIVCRKLRSVVPHVVWVGGNVYYEY